MLKKVAPKDCYCALCRTPRTMNYQRNLSPMHYLQMVLVTVILTWSLFDWLEWKTLASFFFLWAGYEFSRKLLYRRELKCTVCGFDPTWYRRDIRVARRQVEEHLRDHPESPVLRAKKAAERTQITH
ncbi:MAG: hypothetical protein ACLGG7_14090 [Bacteriovoracia bacterium]